MSKSNVFENELLKHIFNNDPIPLIGDATGVRGSTVAGSLYVSLHTADPGEGGDQSTNETAYTNYARVAVARGPAWTVTGNAVANAALVQFATCGVTPGPALTHFGVGTDPSGAGKILYSAPLSSALAIAQNIQPQFGAGELDITED